MLIIQRITMNMLGDSIFMLNLIKNNLCRHFVKHFDRIPNHISDSRKWFVFLRIVILLIIVVVFQKKIVF